MNELGKLYDHILGEKFGVIYKLMLISRVMNIHSKFDGNLAVVAEKHIKYREKIHLTK